MVTKDQTMIKISVEARDWLNEIVGIDPHRFGSQKQALTLLIFEKLRAYKNGQIHPVHKDNLSNLM